MNKEQSKDKSVATDLRRSLDRLRRWYRVRTDDMNQQSIWLFVATLGCWSVNQPYFRLMALTITLSIYFYLASFGLQSRTPARDIRRSIESALASPDLSVEEKRARKQEYGELEDSVMSAANLKRSWLYWLTFTYWIASAAHFAVEFVPNAR